MTCFKVDDFGIVFRNTYKSERYIKDLAVSFNFLKIKTFLGWSLNGFVELQKSVRFYLAQYM